ncbi:FGGY-family pentulose kinase [Leclercia adecarboxylata]|jgi:FGGY-family pentulose kinase|uniref:Ribulokinase n=1 Tax=Leclercia adecarboxylata TaxID=83655 RepID=A0A855EJV3_9ENTR|nr:FGGY family pentulose kinase [Leclercia adecarboxylata]ALZ95856.1 ribulokinase [Leclercia adecarboxylata]KFC97975.1 D-ribulokinase [Leclercia adecarboxylata ATCC 23216 = NBRC 102595]MBK0349218.1 FGGY family pentulose kinase [Leclercia adecarboxylata]MBM6633855.1 FGGY family pentulose kinase [Leclercia adecarboxylata]MDH6162496.1 FGGY-family pentulose kinase [Leclercia adecarboxylata]
MNHVKQTVIGVDVGSGSVRAGVFDLSGQLLSHATHKITTVRRSGQRVEQSSEQIWQAVCRCIADALDSAGVAPQSVAGIGFDATCSLVVLDKDGAPLPVSAEGDAEHNVIVWMDHRATAQAERINATHHPVLNYVGGKISPEMETPKLLWLKEHRREIFDRAGQFFDLADFLTWRATGDLARSICTVTCKWTWLAHENRWDADYFRTIGLSELADENFARIGQRILAPGTPCASGLTEQAAREMGLPVGTPVAVGLIDAHAGGIGTVGVEEGALSNLAYVFGTSSCTMTSTAEPAFVPGVWGPYYSAMVPGLWLSEGGQSAAGAAIDQLLAFHPAAEEARLLAQAAGQPLPVWLADRVMQRCAQPSEAVALAAGLHVVPEFLGNRAPFADPHARAIICGLGMERDLDNLLALYMAGLCGIGYGLRQILDAQRACGVNTRNIAISGGAGQHPLVRQILADACGMPILTTQCSEPVLLGSAILGAVAGNIAPSVTDAMKQFTHVDRYYSPDDAWQALHQRRYDIYKQLQHTAKLIKE